MRNSEINTWLDEHFGRATLISLATTHGLQPSVRTVNAFYADGAFYTITWARSGKMRDIRQNPNVAVSGEWFTAHGVAEDLGHVLAPGNAGMIAVLRDAFAEWYDNGHVNEADPDTVLLRIRLTDGVLFRHGTRYDIEF